MLVEHGMLIEPGIVKAMDFHCLGDVLWKDFLFGAHDVARSGARGSLAVPFGGDVDGHAIASGASRTAVRICKRITSTLSRLSRHRHPMRHPIGLGEVSVVMPPAQTE
jgi:hypothetical protein